jgi:hypothetical protein
MKLQGYRSTNLHDWIVKNLLGQIGRSRYIRYTEHIQIAYSNEDSGYAKYIINSIHQYGIRKDIMKKHLAKKTLNNKHKRKCLYIVTYRPVSRNQLSTKHVSV